MSKVCQLFSGSSGNSILISSKGKNFLVDIGVSSRRCENALTAVGVEPQNIDAVFVTHEHIDHTKGLKVFTGKYNIPVFAPDACIKSMLNSKLINENTEFEIISDNMELGGIEILPFRQSHDSADCVGYRFNLPDLRSVSVCTDTGYVTSDAKRVIDGSDLIFIESNHEVTMVEAGPYPYTLKKRILGAHGHLSNSACGEYIKELAQGGTTRFVLCHLSKENNMPNIARQNVISVLSEIGFKEDIDYRVYVSPPENKDRRIVL